MLVSIKTISIMKARFTYFLAVLTAACGAGSLHATTLSWTGAVDANWSTFGNWSPTPVSLSPSYQSDLVFGSTAGATTLNADSQTSTIASLTFDPLAPAYTMHIAYATGFTINALNGGGITNNSSNTQTLSIDGGNLTFQNSSVLTGATIAVNGSSTNSNYGALYLYGNTNAGTSMITNNAGTAAFLGGGFTTTAINSSLGSATVINNGGAGLGGYITINGNAANAALVANGGLAANQSGGGIRFQGGTGGNATITVNGGNGSNSQAGGLSFQYTSTAGNATVTLNGGTNGGNGAYAYFYDSATGGNAKFVLNSGTTLDIGQTNFGTTVSFGSVEGAGRIYLGGRAIQIGSLNTDTTISGVISDMGLGGQTGGSLEKVGTGKLTLTGTNTYTGGTTVTAGTLAVNGSIQGPTEVKSGATLKGTGTIYGTVTVDAGGIFSPGNSPGTITVQGLALNDTSVLDFELGATSDKIIVQGNLTLDGILNITDAGGFSPNTSYQLFSYTGTLTDNGLQIGTVPAGYSASDFSLSVSGGKLMLSAVPEPGVMALLLAGVAAWPFALRRRGGC
jgi:fibronectin-binding autotransporter adhesin